MFLNYFNFFLSFSQFKSSICGHYLQKILKFHQFFINLLKKYPDFSVQPRYLTFSCSQLLRNFFLIFSQLFNIFATFSSTFSRSIPPKISHFIHKIIFIIFFLNTKKFFFLINFFFLLHVLKKFLFFSAFKLSIQLFFSTFSLMKFSNIFFYNFTIFAIFKVTF